MDAWDYISFLAMVLALGAIIYLLRRSEKKTKIRHKLNAYRLLDDPSPTRKEIVNAIRFLRLYGGTWRKDKEFVELSDRLKSRLNSISG
ncbi:MAG: hypothetical protein WC370_00930 [Dehalococcoidales bacterium]|jgi:hypothetical protein